MNVGNKWEYQTIYHLYNKDFTFTSAYREYTIKNLGDNPVNTSIEIDDIKRNTDYIRLKVNNLKINIENDNKFVTSLKGLEIIPITRYCVNLFPVWLASGNMVGFLDPKYKSLSENYEFAFDLEVKKRRYSKYKFIQNQETIFNNKKYTGYKFSYELNDIIRMNHPLYNTDFNKEGFVNVKGESIFIKGIGIIKDESNIEAEYFYRNERYEGRSLLSSEPIRQKLKYKAISELKNVILK